MFKNSFQIMVGLLQICFIRQKTERTSNIALRNQNYVKNLDLFIIGKIYDTYMQLRSKAWL
jgi:hypothetical protein